jgi:amino acid adenylation domain-containing protein
VTERSRFVEFPRADLDAPIGELFERRAARHPDWPAVKGRGGSFTYAELDAAANRVARAILDRRGPVNEPVALMFEHDAPVLAAILGVLKAGKAYVVLESALATPRLAATLEHADAPLILCDTAHLARARELGGAAREAVEIGPLLASAPAASPGLTISPAAGACLAYTAGSTGVPKGVLGTHRSILHRVMLFVNGARIVPADRLSLVESVGVGGSFRAVFGSLLAGACVLPFDVRTEGADAIVPWLQREAITVCTLAASVFRHFAGALPPGDHFPALRYVAVGREPVLSTDVDLFRTRFAPSCVLVNVMGSAEAGTMCELVIDRDTPIADGVLPVGHPVTDKEILLLGEDGHDVGPGETGEIVVRSEFSAAGYWRRPDLDAQVFPRDPAGARLCRTGDLGRRLPDGSLIHLGRKDARAKLFGRFVDVAEIEAALLQHPAVTGAAVVVREPRPGDQRLVAYVVAPVTPPPAAADLRRHVEAARPGQPAPSSVVFLDALPQTPNGKIDRRALPDPGRERPLDTPYAAPGTPVEEEVASIWAAVLDLDAVGIDDDFTELGGTSLLAGRIAARVGQKFGVDIPVPRLLEAPCVREMAVVVVAELLGLIAESARDRLIGS